MWEGRKWEPGLHGRPAEPCLPCPAALPPISSLPPTRCHPPQRAAADEREELLSGEVADLQVGPLHYYRVVVRCCCCGGTAVAVAESDGVTSRGLAGAAHRCQVQHQVCKPLLTW